MKIEVHQDHAGDPCYIVEGHVDRESFRREIALLSDYGEDAETAEDYDITHTYIVRGPATSQFQGGTWRCVTISDSPVTLAATWTPKEKAPD